MAETKVKTPDGSTVTVAHPEGATQEQILRFAQQQYSAPEPESLAQANPAEYDPLSPEFQEKYGATAGMSNVDKFLSGAGKGLTDVARGIRQRVTEGMGLFSDDFAQKADNLSTNQALVEQRDAPLRQTGAGFGGEMVGNALPFLLPGGAATSLTKAAALGAGEGFLRPTSSSDEILSNVAIGGVGGGAGQLLGKGIGRLARPIKKGASGRVQDAVDLLKKEGVDLDVAQRTGSEGAQRIRSALGDLPMTASAQNKVADRQSRQFTRAVLKTIGKDADELTPDVLNSAYDDVGRAIDDAAKNTPAFVDSQFAKEVQAIQRQLPLIGVDDATQRSINNNVNNLVTAAGRNNGFIPGDVLVSTRSALSKLAQKTPVARDLEGSLLDALERAGGSRAGLKKALAQYRNIKIIENATDKGVEKTISPLRLSNTVQTKANRALSLRGLGHPESVKLAKLAEAGRTLLPETRGNSGTFGRQIAGEALLFAGGAGGAAAGGQDMEGILGAGVGAAALPFALQKAINNQGALGNFLTSGASGAVANPLNSELLSLLTRQGAISGGLLSE